MDGRENEQKRTGEKLFSGLLLFTLALLRRKIGQLYRHNSRFPNHSIMLEIMPATGGQAWDAIYKTLYESLTRFRKSLENGRPKKESVYPSVNDVSSLLY